MKMTSGVLARSGYLAGDDSRRACEIAEALREPDVKAVIAGRGGYGVTRLLEALDLGALRASPRWIVGFSDITALHVLAARAGVASIHGPNVTGLGRTSPRNRGAWLAALERPHAEARWSGLETVYPGRARGQAFGGNLALLEAMAAAGRLHLPPGCVLLLEDVDERPYRVDRMLTSLLAGGHLRRAAAIVLGGFARCPTGKDGVTVEQVLAERTSGLGIPVLAGAPFGHGADNLAVVLGRDASVGDAEVTFPETRGS